MIYQDFLLDYLVEKNNEAQIYYYKDNKDMIINFQNKYSNASGYRKMKSSLNGPFFNLDISFLIEI